MQRASVENGIEEKSPFARWAGVIASDCRQIARETAILARAGGGHAQKWWGGISAWFAFVHHRRNDRRFGVLPEPLRCAEWLAIFASVTYGLFLIADPLFLAMLRSRDPFTMGIFEMVTRLGQSAWVLYLAGAILIAISFFPTNMLGRRRRVQLHDLMLVAYFVFTAIAFSGLIANLLKNLIGRARPQFTPEGMVWLSRPFGDNYDFASFPSGHATTAGALLMALWLLAPRYKVFFILAGVWIAISRPVLGVHFPSDIFAGVAFGTVFTWIYARSFARKRLLFGFTDDGGIKVKPAIARLARLIPAKAITAKVYR
jgi:undecaprenyl-diphosphatase